jgi:ABC-type amino acid transport substrate-binding protein
LGAFIADPSFENIRTLIGEKKVELGILTVTILGLGRTISLVTGALKLLRVTLLAPLITMVTAAAVAMGPVGLVIAGVAALGAALFAISQSEGGFGGLVDNLKLGFLKFKDGVNKFLNFFRDKDDKLPTDSAKEFEEGQMAENIEERKQKRFEKDVQDMSDEEIQARMNDPEFAQRYEQYESRLGELGTNPDERRRRIEEFNRRNNPQQQLMPDPAQSELQFEQQQFDQRLNELQLQQAGMQGGATNVVTTDNSTLNNVVNNSTNSTIVPTTITDTNSSIMSNRME